VNPSVVVVVGPTASGKSALGVALAARLGGEVVNADSMALYRGLDVTTATPNEEERAGITHHLFGVLDPREEASVAAYQTSARATVDALLARGTAAVVVGGSGLHVRALLDDLVFPGTDPVVRAQLEAEAAALGPAALHARLAALDPAAAVTVLPTNTRRLVRALEVIEITGKTFTATLPEPGAARWGAVQVAVDRPSAELDARIDTRVARMWAQGLVEEVRALAALGPGRTAARAIGVASVLRLLDGTIDDAQARAETAQATRRLVRRQRSWFRRDPRVRWLGPPGGGESLAEAAIAEVGLGAGDRPAQR